VAIAAASIIECRAENDAFDGPTFRQGMWHFERTLERVLSTNARHLLMKEDSTRCVNPTNAMRSTFASPDVGKCHSAKPEKVANRYIFRMRCDYMGPVRTEITVENDAAYVEVNEIAVGQVPRIDTIVAHRIGDCASAQAGAGVRSGD